ncbi:hypothetical protein Pla111_11860 [Botrimarina hoheduenensis]|uniref:Type II secretion system protein H n=1 Tax=Botrimarina hoheduenensis TaxID=2528000 RepID=A0A5C5WBY7_9BACT|nr:hypothetical protein Pla111_11860 [Botrimarina hoheduenensis]
MLIRPRGTDVACAARRAFTLIELVIVVMLLGMFAGVAAPRYTKALSGAQLETASKRLAADLRRARAVATQTASPCTIQFRPALKAYGSTDLPDPAQAGAPLDVRLTQDGFNLSMSVTDFDGLNMVTFDWRGDPVNTGSVTLGHGGATRIISVLATGEVEVAR